MTRAAVCAVVLLVTPLTAAARPPHKQSLADHFGPFLAKKLNDCRTCHQPGDAKHDKERPHNPFGARLAAVRSELRKAGKKAEIADRLDAVAAEDSDGDGVPNLVELLAGTNPGEKDDRPDAKQLAAAKATTVALAKWRSGYRWRPFETVTRPAVPHVKDREWGRNPIDAFVRAEQEQRGLKPRPEAAKHVLLRRVYLDLIGLPPTPEEVRAFVNDPAPEAYERVVDRLLASPRYGERWGRHWMDVWRYSDWAGYGAEVRDSQPHIWRWRDWIVESLNEDKGYDRMIVEMLAADEQAPEDAGALRATGFLVRNWYKFNRNVWLDRAVEHTGKAFLGVTINCARCHDHLFDPIGQQEYYQFRAFFEPHNIRTDKVSGELDTNKSGLVRVYDANPKAPTFLFVRGEENQPDKKNPLAPAVPAALGGKELRIEPVKLPASAVAPDKRPWVIAELRAAAEREATAARQALALSAAAFAHRAQRPARLEAAALTFRAAVVKRDALEAVLKAEQLEDAGQTNGAAWKETALAAAKAQREVALLTARRGVLIARSEEGDAPEKAKPVAAKKRLAAEKVLAGAEEAARKPLTTAYTKRNVATYPATSTGRRLALARWIADKDNPLTARVAMNHVWLRHFGSPLVPSVFDFGRNGQAPTHPALLDWLAAEFMDRNWSMKALHRLMVTSSAYRTDSTGDPASAALDPDNRYLWRMNARRLEAEAVRDSVLHVAGRLDGTMGGPEIDHNLGLTVPRRSVYFRHAPEKLMTFLELFDAANVVECYRRSESIVPQQALAMANSSLVLAQSRLLARELAAKANGPAEFVRAGFERVLGRAPTAQEQRLCAEFLSEQEVLLRDRGKLTGFDGGPVSSVPPSADPALRARENLIHVLMNHHEFVTIR